MATPAKVRQATRIRAVADGIFWKTNAAAMNGAHCPDLAVRAPQRMRAAAASSQNLPTPRGDGRGNVLDRGRRHGLPSARQGGGPETKEREETR